MEDLIFYLEEAETETWDKELFASSIEQFNQFLLKNVIEKPLKSNRVISRTIMKRIVIGEEEDIITVNCSVNRQRGDKIKIGYTIKEPYGAEIFSIKVELETLEDVVGFFDSLVSTINETDF